MKILKKTGILIAFACIFLLSLSSCGRGYGCPYDLSISKSTFQLVASGIDFLIRLF